MPSVPELNQKISISLAALAMIIGTTFTLSSVYFNFKLMDKDLESLERRDGNRYERNLELINENKILTWKLTAEDRRNIESLDERLDKIEFKVERLTEDTKELKKLK